MASKTYLTMNAPLIFHMMRDVMLLETFNLPITHQHITSYYGEGGLLFEVRYSFSYTQNPCLKATYLEIGDTVCHLKRYLLCYEDPPRRPNALRYDVALKTHKDLVAFLEFNPDVVKNLLSYEGHRKNPSYR